MLERFVNLINVNLAVFLQARWLYRSMGWKDKDFYRIGEVTYNSDLTAWHGILGLFLSLPMMVIFSRIFGEINWKIFVVALLSLALSYLFHWYFLYHKSKWRKYWLEYKNQTKSQRIIWAVITLITYSLYLSACFVGALRIQNM